MLAANPDIAEGTVVGVNDALKDATIRKRKEVSELVELVPKTRSGEMVRGTIKLADIGYPCAPAAS